MDKNIKAFVVHISSLEPKITIHLARKAQIALLLAKEVTLFTKYLDFTDVFLEESVNVFSEQTGVNEHAIKFGKGKQPSYGPIYSLCPIELKILKTYIETNLTNGFIRALNSSASAPILFVCKLHGSFHLYINYQSLNNLTIKNRYLLPLIGESLDQLGQAK